MGLMEADDAWLDDNDVMLFHALTGRNAAF